MATEEKPRSSGLPNAHEGAIHGPKESLDVEHDILTLRPQQLETTSVDTKEG